MRYACEWHDSDRQWIRSHGTENLALDKKGLMTERHASINDIAISESDRRFFWPQGARPDDHPGISEMDL